MKHLHFTQALEPLNGGGMGLSTVALHRQLRGMGVDSTLCSTYSDAPQKPAEAVLEFRRIKPDFLYYSPALRERAKQLVASADVIHGHGLYVGTNYLLGSECRRQGRPLVYHTHGFLDPWILNRSRWKKRLVHWLFENANFQHARLWRALTTKEADQIRAQGIRGPVVVVPVGLDVASFNVPFQRGDEIETPLVPHLVNQRRFRAVFISRLHPKKGLDILLPAWAKLAAERREWELIIAGPDEGGYAATVDGLIREFALEDSVRRVGKISHASKVKLLKSADVFVLPSYSEGFTSAILEAMAASVPVVATRECNFPELFQNGGGWECDVNLDSLADSLREAVTASETERHQRGAAGRKLLERDYTWESVCRHLLQACANYCNQ
ncbi:MAG TPA: glycosyltransferase [Verrucomicrobiae bacterium]|jgi:glycosyltransferase involved in cell wall biosynthesis|nr:glycosyltransferase [Verrucomicrobiae bacterium]